MPNTHQKASTPWAPFHNIHIQSEIFFFLEPLVRSSTGDQATRGSSKISTRYGDSVQQLLSVICACHNFSLPPVWEDEVFGAVLAASPELHLARKKVGSCGLVNGELVMRGRRSSGFSGKALLEEQPR